MSQKQYAKVTEVNGIPRFSEALPPGRPHVVAMIVGCVTPAIILSGVTGLSASDQVRLIQASLLISGLATLIQLFPPFRLCGSGLPVIMGASFAHVPLLLPWEHSSECPPYWEHSWQAACGNPCEYFIIS